MTDEIDQLTVGINQVSEDIFSIEYEQKKLGKYNDRVAMLFSEQNRVFNELESTWVKGNMRRLLDQIQFETRSYERELNNNIEENIENFKKEKYELQEKEEALRYERKKKLQEDY